MSISQIFDQFEVLIVILTILSLSMYVFFAYCEIKNGKQAEHIHFVDNIIAFSMIWIIFCMVIVLSFLYQNNSEHHRVVLEIMCFTALIVSILLIGAIDLFKKKKFHFIPLFPASILLISAVIVCFWLKLPLHTILNFSLGLFSTMSILFAKAALKHNRKAAHVGLLYLLSGISIIIIIIIINNLNPWISFHFTLTLDLALSMLLIVGFFVYYCEIYSIHILDNIQRIQLKNDRLLEAERRITWLAYFDQITQIKNVYHLQEDLTTFRSNWRASSLVQIQFYLINLHNFKAFSNFVGYEKGNSTLFEVALRLKKLCIVKDEIYRFYSDRFILVHFGDHETGQGLISNIQEMFNANRFFGRSFDSYIGATEWSTAPKTFDILIQEMELASQSAFIQKQPIAYYSDEMFQILKQRLSLENALREASDEHVWEVVYQPKVSLLHNRIVGAEALIRWNHHGTYISPEIFIPLAEQLGLIHEIGYHVMKTTFSFLRKIQTKDHVSIGLSINLSPSQLMEPNFVQLVKTTAAHYDINPAFVTFEITESTLISNIERVHESIQLLKNHGFSFSLDDFGVGYSSIHYFSRLNFDEVKLDKTFTESLPYDLKNRIILNSITTMAKTLGIVIVIEGVELKEQLDIIREIDCDYYQGYYFSKPVPPDELLSLILSQE
ncbi:GGDEF domain-containing protein [Paenibacillus sp. SYP-B3998]|uniref:GGDEF domain-containing protein n=1 Tax=Paenibacillus sp. SYP-B3998 TaxID=2678564 RepID=A0A6G3ZRQ5_9BACL|nr:bifunctional diguanylate cyclase/phosphodiesterase [Paenibacillus sp. SYP-B3998]NEW04718.1 GGDEF domain-containing protein [Paenibacillus sp. SYP-B3998]